MSDLSRLLIKLRGDESLRDVAKRAQISHSYLSHLEKGRDPRTGKPLYPSPDTLKSLSKAYNYPYEKMLAAAGYLPASTPVTKRDIKQYENFRNHAQTFFMDDEVADEDKEKIFRDITELFWESKEKNKKKYGRKKEGK
ncbi:helix-turn-helix domain-containing protein [Candidatus Formimonas warabiya]|uniref:helix-turn-helix domain-containing protein n=1 Tax=Formimonas warabiya TaxID=1761012 RepID=UPI0011D0C3A1|nr:helix-turn-helix transcriptional regulator [Candidatus Formimonas warabiya]